ncbi:hypothetical protein DICVIV_06987 [Dictyocaulus viviparus]|uniref:Uncharacterized protein n=1 Tax=Dictyocaulus viviparus TaxID=29172 RepID=A0A0D8XSX3_DICVI|nr:hypothetical protein DICVIV_06987 [Dictyocaulus viviparus]
MLRLLFALTVPTTVYTAVQCYVGQKLFSYESNNAICARFIPYHCAAQCEWLTDERNRNKCTWRDTESIVILSPSIRTNPVLAPNHYIRDARMERDGKSRVDVTLEVCQYRTEREHCNLERMTEEERQSFESITQKLHRSEEIRTVQKSGDTLKTSSDDKTARDCVTLAKECEEEIKSRMRTCCHDKSRCDNACLKGIEKSLSEERTRKNKGCSVQEIQFGINCLSRKINNLILKR